MSPARSLAPLLMLCAAAGLSPGAEIVGGPYVVNATSRSATIAWIVQDSEVKVSEAGGFWRASPPLRCEKVSISGLKPGSKFDYTAFAGEGGTGSFKTPPADDAPYRFVVFGDTRTRHDVHRRVIAAIVKDNPDFVVHTGDLVADGNDDLQWPVFFSIERDLLRKAAFFPVLGNHERNCRQFYEYFDLRSPYYSFDWGSAHFTLLDSDLASAAPGKAAREAFWKQQLGWMEEDLARAHNARFRFVVMHNPPFTAMSSRQEASKEMQAIVPLVEKYGVAAVFAGHDHAYQHHLVNGVHYVVTGGGGAPLYTLDKPLAGITQKTESIEHFVSVAVDGKSVILRAQALDRRLIEEIRLGQAAAAASAGR